MFAPPVVVEKAKDRRSPRKEVVPWPLTPSPNISRQQELQAKLWAGDSSQKEREELQRLSHTSRLQQRKHGQKLGGAYGRLLERGRKQRAALEQKATEGLVLRNLHGR